MLTTKGNQEKNDPSIYECDAKSLKEKLKKGADPNFIRKTDNYFKNPALSFAIGSNKTNRIDIIKVFLKDPRTDVNKVNKFGNTPLIQACHYSVAEKTSEPVSLLLAHPKIEVNKSGEYGNRPIHVACSSTLLLASLYAGKNLFWRKEFKVIDVFKLLVNDERTDVNAINDRDKTALILACEASKVDDICCDLVSLLLKHPQLDVNTKDRNGLTALHLACYYSIPECTKLLVDDPRVNINTHNNFGYSPLYSAVRMGRLETVKALLSSTSINPNILSFGKTPLHRAFEKGYKDIMIELLKHERIDASIPDKDGKIVAAQIRDPEILEYLGQPKCYKDIFCI